MDLRRIFFALPMIVGCALPVSAAETTAAVTTFGDYQAKGFLSDYSKLPKNPNAEGVYRYLDPSANLGQYNKLLVDRIRVWFKEDSEYKGIDADELKMLTDYFYESIETALGDAYPMVAEPGPDVLRLRIALTDVVPNKPEAAVAGLVVPFLWVGEAAAGAVKGETGSSPFTGEATIEMEALDSTGGTQYAAYIETDVGKKYQWSEGISEGISSYRRAYSKWDYTKKAIDSWAQFIRQRLDEAHGKAVDG